MARKLNFNEKLYHWFLFQLYNLNEELGLYVPDEVLVYSSKVLSKEIKEKSTNKDWLDIFRNTQNEFEMLYAIKEAGDEKIVRGGWFYESYKFFNLSDIVGLGAFFFQQASNLAKNLGLIEESNVYKKVSDNFENLIIEIRELRRNCDELKNVYSLFGKEEIKNRITEI